MEDLVQGIKIKSDSPNAACIKIARKYTNLSISTIKQTIVDNGMFLESEMSDMDSLVNIIQMYDALTSAGITCELYELGQREKIEVFRNRLQRNKEISEETWQEMFREAEDD